MNTYRAVQYWYIRAPHYIQSCISELLNTFRAVYPSTYIHTVQSCTVPVNPGTSIHKDLYIRAPQYIQSIYIRAPQYIQSCISEHLHTYSELYTVQYNTAYPSTPAHTVQYGDLSENSIVQYIYPSRLTHTCSTEIYPRTLLYICISKQTDTFMQYGDLSENSIVHISKQTDTYMQYGDLSEIYIVHI